MTITVQKFGGTSVGTIERIRHVASWALDTQAQGHQVVLVVSAMAGETNRLVELATQIHPVPYSREYDLLIASGEQISVGLVTLAINTEAEKRGLLRTQKTAARGLLAHQIRIFTDSVFSKARIQAIDAHLIKNELSQGVIPVIAGFQGVDPENNITTLGRGGSDTSAVAIAAALGAKSCEIYTDVDGVYTTDPRLCKEARKIKRISYEEMMELASLGAKVLQIRSVELAAKYKIPLHVRSSFQPVEGTLVMSQEQISESIGPMENVVVAGVASESAQVKFTLQNLPHTPDSTAKVFQELSDANVVVDVIVQDVSTSGSLSIGFTTGKSDALKARQVLEALKASEFRNLQILEEPDLAKVSIVGVGMRHYPGVASKLFRLLAESQIKIKMISTSEIKISCLIPGADEKKAVESLHRGFELHRVE